MYRSIPKKRLWSILEVPRMLTDAFWVLTDWDYKFNNFWQNSWERDYGLDVRDEKYTVGGIKWLNK